MALTNVTRLVGFRTKNGQMHGGSICQSILVVITENKAKAP